MSKSSTPGRPRSKTRAGEGYELASFLDAQWPLRVTGTNEDVAAVLGLNSPNLISHWRTGRTPVSAKHLVPLAKLLDVEIGTLLLMWVEQFRRDQRMPRFIADLLVERLASTNEAELLMWVRGTTRGTDPYFPAATLVELCKLVNVENSP